MARLTNSKASPPVTSMTNRSLGRRKSLEKARIQLVREAFMRGMPLRPAGIINLPS
jgi:hypothetical protein